MANIEACLSTGKDNWRTPIELFKYYDDIFHFNVDLAADQSNALCMNWYGPGHININRHDALTANIDETGWAWCNPPYSKGLQSKFIELCAKRRKCVMLLPARTDTKMFHSYIWNSAIDKPRDGIEVHFIKGRIKFLNEHGATMKDKHGRSVGAPFPSMIVKFL